MDVNIQEDLNTVNNQITKLVEELNKMTVARENLVTQVQNLNGVAMYLRGKHRRRYEPLQRDWQLTPQAGAITRRL